MNILKLFTALFALVFLASCATIFKGSDAEVRVNSQPDMAKISINGIDKGHTPETLILDRSEDHILTLSKDGYENTRVEVSKTFDGGTTILGNLVSWNLLGIIVDVSTGGAYSLEPADVHQNLESMKAAGVIDEIPEQKEGELTVIMLTKEQWEEVRAD